MPEFFTFTQGAESNPRLPGAETTPLLVGRFRAVVPPSDATVGQQSSLPSAGPLPNRSRQRPSLVASRSYWNAPVSLLRSTPSPPLSTSGRRVGILQRSATASESLHNGRSGDPGRVVGHGFYNNTGYGAIAAAGDYNGIGNDEEDEEQSEEGASQYDDGYEEDVEDDDENEGDDDDSDSDYEDDERGTVDNSLTSTLGGPKANDPVANGVFLISRRSDMRTSTWFAWPWSPWARQRQNSIIATSSVVARPDDICQSSVAAFAPQATQCYPLDQTLRRQQQRRQQRHRLRRKISRSCRLYRYCGRRAGRWTRRTLQRIGRNLRNLWLTPKNATVRRAVDRWWSRWTLLVVLPALLAVAWCALPFPQYPLEEVTVHVSPEGNKHHRTPGHGEARVRIDFWFFLLAYYGPYNVTALVWITKVFNLYSLNWWPSSLGFPISVSLLAAFSLAVPAVLFSSVPAVEFLASHNTVWVTWTFAVMAMPVAAALFLLLVHERHRAQRHAISDTQRIFTSARWAGEPSTLPRRQRLLQQQQQYSHKRTAEAGRFRVPLFGRARAESLPVAPVANNESDSLGRALVSPRPESETSSLLGVRSSEGRFMLPAITDDTLLDASSLSRGRDDSWLPASFVRFLWLMSALFTSLLVYELGEASASLFLAALPTMQHATVYTVAYVYGWIVTVFLLDLLTGWILGGRQGERVGSYPLGWVFKLYFMLTYQTYVRALYVRLRSPSQFVLLQVLSSTTLIIISPLLMCSWTHRLLVALGLNAQTYGAFQKVCVRNIFLRIVAENASMLAFLGSLLVLHFGPNCDVYPYFAFDGGLDGGPGYTFSFTLYASSITWACELGTAFIVSGLIRYFYGLSVVGEGKMDLAVWPELLPTSVAVSVHVLQNMLFSIIRLRFW
ncbi:hypothetical protein SEPCBS119000_003188 [Sporothrix epigloea]|uniref:Uncharacterized protein n=1 Tax=Sporothrix epigloea TaxID=1892477 RepID=A0ABP0DKH1_9PEZI